MKMQDFEDRYFINEKMRDFEKIYHISRKFERKTLNKTKEL